MRRFLLLLCALLGACSTPAELVLNETDNGRFSDVLTGEKVVISLSENQTTGYSWRFFAAPVGFFADVHEEYIAPNTTLLGAGGVKRYSFTVNSVGRATLTAFYYRPWEPLDMQKDLRVEFYFSAK